MGKKLRQEQDAEARAFFEKLWRKGDFWELDSSEFERDRLARLLSVVADRQYGRVLEIGCGAGSFTRLIAHLAQRIVALDVSDTAIQRAQGRLPEGHVEFRQANVMEYDPQAEGPWDLITLAETVYYLGWLYTFFDVAWLAATLFVATSTGGRLLLTNTFGEFDMLLRPSLIRTYRDLFVNVGYTVAHEEVHRGTKDEVEIEVLTTLFERR